MKQKKHNPVKYRLRDDKGRFVTKVFHEAIVRSLAAQRKVSNFEGEGKKQRQVPIKKVIKEADITPKDVYEFYNTNKDVFIDMLHTGSVGLPKNSNQLDRDLTNYKGEIYLNGKKVSNSEAKLQLVKFKQSLSNSINVVDFTIKPTIYFDGKIEINIPNTEQLQEDLIEHFGVENIDQVNDEFTGGEITDALSEILGEYYEDDEIVIYAS